MGDEPQTTSCQNVAAEQSTFGVVEQAYIVAIGRRAASDAAGIGARVTPDLGQ